MAAEKPAIKVVAKHKTKGNTPITLLAAWRGERGLNGRLDRSIVAMTLHMADGSTVTIDRDYQGRESHWINVYDTPQQQQQQRRPQRAAPSPDDSFDDEDLPF